MKIYSKNKFTVKTYCNFYSKNKTTVEINIKIHSGFHSKIKIIVKSIAIFTVIIIYGVSFTFLTQYYYDKKEANTKGIK